jgi:hypothetical protein
MYLIFYCFEKLYAPLKVCQHAALRYKKPLSRALNWLNILNPGELVLKIENIALEIMHRM